MMNELNPMDNAAVALILGGLILVGAVIFAALFIWRYHREVGVDQNPQRTLTGNRVTTLFAVGSSLLVVIVARWCGRPVVSPATGFISVGLGLLSGAVGFFYDEHKRRTRCIPVVASPDPTPQIPLLIWWTNQAQCQVIRDDDLAAGLPDYIKSEFTSRFGRSGRCQIWADESLPEVRINPWPDTVLSQTLEAGSYGGIVFRAEDYDHVRPLPGLLTTCNLTLIDAYRHLPSIYLKARHT